MALGTKWIEVELD